MSTTRRTILEVKDVYVSYEGVEALHGMSVRVDEGEIITILGANGAGKSSFLNAVAGLVPMTSGRVLFEGKAIEGLRAEKIVKLGLSFVPEGRQLFYSMTVTDNLALGAYHRNSRERKEIRKDYSAIFERFPVLKERASQLAGTLSGGEQQMLAIGRGLMSNPKLLLLDEPSLGLAPLLVRELMAVLAALRKEGVTILFAEQNAREALCIADRGYVMEIGRKTLEGQTDFLLSNKAVRAAYLGGKRRV